MVRTLFHKYGSWTLPPELYPFVSLLVKKTSLLGGCRGVLRPYRSNIFCRGSVGDRLLNYLWLPRGGFISFAPSAVISADFSRKSSMLDIVLLLLFEIEIEK